MLKSTKAALVLKHALRVYVLAVCTAESAERIFSFEVHYVIARNLIRDKKEIKGGTHFAQGNPLVDPLMRGG